MSVVNQYNILALEIDSVDDEDSLELDLDSGGANSGGSYNLLTDKPKINGNVLQGDKTGKELNLQDEMREMTFQEIDELIFGGM